MAMANNRNVNTRGGRKPYSLKAVRVYNLWPREINSKASVKFEGHIRHNITPPGMSVSVQHRGPALHTGPDNGSKEKHAVSNLRASVAPNCPRSNVLVKSGNSRTRRLKPPYCAVCGEILTLYTPPKRRNQVQAKSRSTGSEQPKVRVKTRTTNSFNMAPKKLTIWTGIYPKVKLCNLAKCACEVAVQDLCFVLPVGQKTEVGRDFKRHLGTSEPQRLTVHQQTLTGAHTAKTASANPTASLFPEDKTSEHPTDFPSPHLRARWVSGAGMSRKDVEEDCGAGNDCIAAEKWGTKRIRLGRSGIDETASLAQDQNSCSVTDLEWQAGITMTAAGGRGVESVMSSDSQSCLDTGICYSDASDTHVSSTHGSVRQDGGRRTDPGGSDTSRESSESGMFSIGPDENKSAPDSGSESENVFSCQRVIPHRPQLSCARTYLTWPFPKSDPPSVTRARDSNETLPVGPVELSADPVNCALGSTDRHSSVSTERTTVIPTHGATDTTPSISHHRSPQREECSRKSDITEGEQEEGGLSEEDRGGEKKPLSPFSDRPSEAASSFPPVPKTDMAAVSILPPLKDRAEMDVAPGPASTPTAAGLRDLPGAAATSSSPTPLSSAPDNSESEHPSPRQRANPPAQLPRARTGAPGPPLKRGPPSVTDVRRGGDETLATASSPALFPRAPVDAHGLEPSSASPSPNKDVTRPPTSILSPSTPPPASKHGDEEDATSDLNSSGDCSETDTASSPPHSHLQSLEDSFHSSLVLTQMQSEPDQTQSYSGEEEGREEEEEGIEEEEEEEEGGEEEEEGSEEEEEGSEEEEEGGEEEEEGSEEEDVCGESQPSSSGDQCQGSGSTGDARAELLDEFSAYEQDILVVSVQEDPELFGNLPEKSLLGPGATRGAGVPGAWTSRELITSLSRRGRAVCATKKSLTTDAIEINGVKTYRRKFIRFNDESSSHPSLKHSNSWPPVDTKDQLPRNNNKVKEPSERTTDIQTLDYSDSTIPLCMPMDECDGRTSPSESPSGDIPDTTQKYSQYCRYYFQENSTCFYKNCGFLHLPREGDEKFCVETVLRFSRCQSLLAVQKAVTVFTGYYQSSPPGAHFTPLLLSSLLAALLKAGLVPDIIAVLNVSVAHQILPSPAFLLSLFDYVGQEGLRSPVAELMQLTSKMVEAGLVLSVDYCERVFHCLDFHTPPQMDSLIPAPANLRSPFIKTPNTEPMNVAHAILEVELCTEKEDWSRMGAVFLSVCRSDRGVGELQHFSGCVAIALLPVTKDKPVLPFATFSERVHQGACEDDVVMAFLGRIGVSLMCRYHKTQQWVKGRKVVEVLSKLKVNYSTLKGLFGNEDTASRCRLVTAAAELFLHSGSVEGALNTLRDNEWFLSSSAWPCEPADVADRSHMLVRLAEKTSHRDTLEVLTNLPGLKDPTDMADASRYAGLFGEHLRACVERNTLSVASDALDFMLSKALAVEPPLLLHALLHKLGDAHRWLRARVLFKRALRVGYYAGMSALPGSLVLTVPCLGEMELALALEMFITVNAVAVLDTTDKTACLSITLKRTCDSESEYLSAGSCVLSAAVVLKPPVTVRYQSVSPSQEQVFTLHTLSAQRWLRHNRYWASELWTHSP